VTGSWWETIDTGEGYTRADDLAAWSLRPVTRGLVGWFEARKVVGLSDLTLQSVLTDLSDEHNDLVCQDINPLAYRTNPARWEHSTGSFGQGFYKAAKDFSGQLSDITLSWAGAVDLYHNSTVPLSFGWSLGDSWFGPRYGLSNRVCNNRHPLDGQCDPADPCVLTPVVPTDTLHVMQVQRRTGIEDLAFYDGQVYRSGEGWSSGGVSFPYKYLPIDAMEIRRGNPFQTYYAMLFYACCLTLAELQQNDAYLRYITGLAG
jgi:hypothetical protein